MLTLLAVCGFCLFLIGERADRVYEARAVSETGVRSELGLAETAHAEKATQQARPFAAGSGTTDSANHSPVSLTVPRPAGLYRGKPARYWAFMYRERTRQLQQARRALWHSIQRPVYGMSPDERAFMCIHGFEGSWTDPNPPHWGGLQMDLAFQRTYGGWALRAFGTADRWPVSVQLAVAIRAKVSGRGFYPWPNTARMCGLIR